MRSKTHMDLSQDRVVFRRVHGRIIPVRVGAWERTKDALKSSAAPAVVAAVLTEGIAAATKSKRTTGALFSTNIAAHFGRLSTLKSTAKIAALTVAFGVGYNILFGARQKNIVKLDKPKKAKGGARIWLASKAALTGAGHEGGEHSYLHVRDRRGKVTVFGGQIKELTKYGDSGVRLVRNYDSDKVSRAQNIHDLTPTAGADRAVSRLHSSANRLQRQLKRKDYEYRMVPSKPGTYNSNSVVGTLVRRAGIKFRASDKHHNLPGFNRTIPRG